ncbi:MAG: hybrid sensor histidine kinase/response regulator [Pseudomonadota bacterium]|nr:hybrid sensor histidine kinase/response regulator [Pseudomonadota bacterium]
MNTRAAIHWATRLSHLEDRNGALRELAQQVGAQDALILVRDDVSGAMLPVPGARQTLPRGTGWRRLLQAMQSPGTVHAEVEALYGAGMQTVLAHSEAGVALALVGGTPQAQVLDALLPIFPLLGSVLSCEQQSRAMTGELRTAHSEMRQYAAQAQILDETRLKLDETVRKLGEQARRAVEAGRAKDEFLAMLGHELRNPLSPIVTTLEVMRLRGAWQPELDVVKRQVQHMQRLVEDLLDISRIARGKLTLAREPLDLSGVLMLAREAAPELARKRQPLQWDVPGDGLWVSGDRSRLVQVFSNLFDNAAKYSNEDTEIRVHARVDNGRVRVSVHDHGIGLCDGQLEQVFEMFEQGGRAGAYAGGLGLGLAIVRNLVRHHDGRVWAESDGASCGSSFHVELPLVDGASEPIGIAHVAQAEALPVRVMLVDDNADALTTLGLLLGLCGCEVLEVGSGAEALAQAPDFGPEVAVLDIGMPVMDGVTLARCLRERLGEATPQLVALTGFGQPADRERALEAGFDAFLVKPVDPALLEQTIRQLRAVQLTPAVGR